MGGYLAGCLRIKHGLELPSYEIRLQAQIVPKMGFEGTKKRLWVPMSQKFGLKMLPLLLLLAAPLIRGDLKWIESIFGMKMTTACMILI